jgi:ABC-type multidrug transport system fused ATPase/permease subunit
VDIPLKQYWELLARHIKPQMQRFLLLTVLLLTGIGLRLVNPQIVRAFIDTAIAGEGGETLVYVALAYVGMALLQQVVAVSATYVGENVAWTATNALRAELAHHCMHLDMGFHNQHPPGELIERIDGDVSQLATFFSQMVIYVVGNLLLLAGILVALLFEDWRLSVAFGLFAVLALYVLNRVRGLAVPYEKARRQAEADLFGYVEEQLAGTEDIRSSGAVGYVIRGLYELQFKILQIARKAQYRHWLIHVAGDLLLAAGKAVAVGAGYLLFARGRASVGTVYLIVDYFRLLGRPLWELTRQVESMQTIGASIQRLTELRHLQSAVRDGPGAAIPDGPLSLAFDDVSFSYVEEEPVLRGLSFSLQPGTVLGLLGRTGSGKTTLARLVFRLYDATVGQVVLGGVRVSQPKLESLRRRVALVTQDVQLFQASVRDNLTFFDRNISDERIYQVIEELELRDWYESLPEGLDTQLEAGGRGLSAGEAQLLAFTRVFLRDPGLVILDEASSRLDPATEQRIERAIDKLLRGRTAIIIAHRLGTVHRADEIMILDRGRVSEHGNREQLAGDTRSRFYGLLQTGLEEVLA